MNTLRPIAILTLALAACVAPGPSSQQRVHAIASEIDQAPRQVCIEAVVDGDLFPRLITLADRPASAFVGEVTEGHEQGRTLRVFIEGDLAELTLIENRGAQGSQEVWRASVPIQGPRATAATPAAAR